MTKIRQIATAVPEYRHDQDSIARYMEEAYEKAFAVRQVYRDTHIHTRYSVLEDFRNGAQSLFFNGHQPGISERMDFYFRQAPELAESAIRQLAGFEKMTHLITVSCTGLAAPGLEIMLQKKLNLSPSLKKATVNFMGCYAALHGLRLADWIVKSEPGAKVVVVCVELCTLHFRKEYTLDNLTSSSLFGDGAAAVMLEAEGEGPELTGFFTRVYPEGQNDMSWDLDEHGFLMGLSRHVPDRLKLNLYQSLSEELDVLGTSREAITAFAVHPGGKRILEAVEESLNLSSSDLDASWAVLNEYGNMSSPSILFVLQRILENKGSLPAVALAFGPGLTMEGVLLQ